MDGQSNPAQRIRDLQAELERLRETELLPYRAIVEAPRVWALLPSRPSSKAITEKCRFRPRQPERLSSWLFRQQRVLSREAARAPQGLSARLRLVWARASAQPPP